MLDKSDGAATGTSDDANVPRHSRSATTTSALIERYDDAMKNVVALAMSWHTCDLDAKAAALRDVIECGPGDGEHGWLGAEQNLLPWNDFPTLVEQFNSTLLKTSAKDFKRKLADAEAVEDSLKETKETLMGFDFELELVELKSLVKQGHMRKFIATAMRTLSKSSDREAKRSVVVAEIQALQQKYGKAFDYAACVPAALGKEVGMLVDMRRKSKAA